MDEGLVLLAAVVLLALVGGPALAIAAWVRIRRLEARIASLEGRRPVGTSTAVPALPHPPVPPPPEPISAAPPLVPIPESSAGFDWETLIAGRWLNRVGLAAVAVGVSYFLKYAVDNDWIGPRGQVALGVLLGTALVAASPWLLKRGLVYFADGLTGLGLAVLYLSLWAGGSYYHLMSTEAAFAAMIVVTAVTLALAIGRNSQRIAVLGLLGGFLTPWLLSTGRDAQVVLFTYLALHNGALLALARARDWRFLEVPAFAFTQIYFLGWYDRFYSDSRLMSTAAFATVFFLEFAALPVIRSRRTGTLFAEQVALVLYNVACLLAALREMMWPDSRWTLTVATMALAAFHLVSARAVPPVAGAVPLARLVFAGVALTLVTLVIPMRLDGRWITMAWAVEAAVLMWTGFRADVRYLRIAAFVLFVLAGMRLMAFPIPATEFLINARFGTALVAAACVLASLYLARRYSGLIGQAERGPFMVLAVSVNVLLVWALTNEVDLYFGSPRRFLDIEGSLAKSLAISILWAIYASTLVLLGVRFASQGLRWQGLALLGITTAKVFVADLAFLRGFYRIISSVALGVVLIVVSLLYQRKLAADKARGPS